MATSDAAVDDPLSERTDSVRQYGSAQAGRPGVGRR